jgi:hypothetical protein
LDAAEHLVLKCLAVHQHRRHPHTNFVEMAAARKQNVRVQARVSPCPPPLALQ